MERISKNILANLLANSWSVALLLLLTPMYIALLGIEGYGLIGLYMSMAVILGILDTGISATVVREIAWYSVRPEGRSKIPILLHSVEIIYWSTILIIGGLLIWGAWFFGNDWFRAKELSDTELNHVLMLMVGALVLQVPCGLYVGGLMGLQRQVECSWLLVFWGTVRGFGSIAVLWLWEPSVEIFFLWQIMVGVAQVAMMRWALWRRINDAEGLASFSWRELHSLKGFAGGMLMITISGVLLSQSDKIILSRLVSLELFGFYTLAWTVASGLTRVATPLIQAFSPHFTELVSVGKHEEMQQQLSLASQVMSVLILPPAVLIAVFGEPILTAWTRNPLVAAGAAPLLSLLVVGTAFASCSYPALSALYSRKQIGVVVAINFLALVIFMPLLIWAIVKSGAIGAASVWVLYGIYQYMGYQFLERRGRTPTSVFGPLVQNFVAPLLTSVLVAVLVFLWLGDSPSDIKLLLSLCVGLILSWLAALFVCGDLFGIVAEKVKCRPLFSR